MSQPKMENRVKVEPKIVIHNVEIPAIPYEDPFLQQAVTSIQGQQAPEAPAWENIDRQMFDLHHQNGNQFLNMAEFDNDDDDEVAVSNPIISSPQPPPPPPMSRRARVSAPKKQNTDWVLNFNVVGTTFGCKICRQTSFSKL
jgi:hypothetical protein